MFIGRDEIELTREAGGPEMRALLRGRGRSPSSIGGRPTAAIQATVKSSPRNAPPALSRDSSPGEKHQEIYKDLPKGTRRYEENLSNAKLSNLIQQNAQRLASLIAAYKKYPYDQTKQKINSLNEFLDDLHTIQSMRDL